MNRTTYHLRARKFLRDACERCGATEELQAHHRDTDITNNDPKNIETVCKPCHIRGHWEEKRAERDAARSCEFCGAEITRRRPNGSLRLRRDFLTQRFCSKRCSTTARYSHRSAA